MTISRFTPAMSYASTRMRPVEQAPPIVFQRRSLSGFKQQALYSNPSKKDVTFRRQNHEANNETNNRFGFLTVLLTLGACNYLMWIYYRYQLSQTMPNFHPSTTNESLTWMEMVQMRSLIDLSNASQVRRIQTIYATYRMLSWDEMTYLRNVNEAMNAMEVRRIEMLFPRGPETLEITASESSNDPPSTAEVRSMSS